jgi:hypothetical protein
LSKLRNGSKRNRSIESGWALSTNNVVQKTTINYTAAQPKKSGLPVVMTKETCSREAGFIAS